MNPAHRLPGWKAWSLAIAVGMGLVLMLAAVLVSLRLEKALVDLLQQRSQVLARQVALAAEAGLRFGVALADQPELPRKLHTLSRSDSRVLSMAVVDDQGRALHGPTGAAPPPRPASATTHWTDGQGLHTWHPIHDATGSTVGAVWLLYAPTEAHTAWADSFRRLGWWALGLTLAVTAVLTAGVAWGTQRLNAQLARWTHSVQASHTTAQPHSEPFSSPWPLLPLPQAWQRVARLEQELNAVLAAPAGVSPARHPPKPPVWRRSGAAVWALAAGGALVAGAVFTLAWVARGTGIERVTPTLEANSQAMAQDLKLQLERAMALGIPPQEWVGVQPWLAEPLHRHREVLFFALLSPTDEVLAWVPSPHLSAAQNAVLRAPGAAMPHTLGTGALTVRTPLQASPQAPAFGWLVAGFDPLYIDKHVNAVVGDLLVAVLVALVVVLEVLRFAGQRQGWGVLWQLRGFLQQVRRGALNVLPPLAVEGLWGHATRLLNERIERLHQRWASAREPSGPHHSAQRAVELERWGRAVGFAQPRQGWSPLADLSRLRAAVFLVALSDELVRPFLAVLASSLPGPVGWSGSALAGITLSAFLLTWAVSQPFGAGLLQRHGARRCMAGASALVALSLLATVWATHWWVLTVLRALTGVAFGLVLIFSQTLMLRVGREGGRAAAVGEFVAAVVAAGICGPVLGGVMQVKWGTPATLAVAATCAWGAWVLVRGLGAIAAPERSGPPLSWRSLGALLRHRRLVGLLVFSAIPGKLAATSALLLLIPLSVTALGESASTTGRLLLLYFLAFWLVARWAGQRSDRQNARKRFVVVGGALSALACLLAYGVGGVLGLALLAGLLGWGQAWLSSAQIVWATQMSAVSPAGPLPAGANTASPVVDAEVTLGLYRLVERLGGALGPVLAAGMGTLVGTSGTLLALAALLGLGTLATAWGLHETASTGSTA